MFGVSGVEVFYRCSRLSFKRFEVRGGIVLCGIFIGIINFVVVRVGSWVGGVSLS